MGTHTRGYNSWSALAWMPGMSWCQGSKHSCQSIHWLLVFLQSNGIWVSHKTFVEIVPSLWSAAKSKWMLLSTNDQIDFRKVLPLVWSRTCRTCWTSRANDRKTFLQFGPLIGYLLTADYSYTGVVSPPSLDDMADMIAHINSGGVKGLEALGILPDTHKMRVDARIAAVKSAFEIFYELPGQVSNGREEGIIGFNYVMVEHVLCKIAHLKLLQ